VNPRRPSNLPPDVTQPGVVRVVATSEPVDRVVHAEACSWVMACLRRVAARQAKERSHA
jgi:hypothetical protein